MFLHMMNEKGHSSSKSRERYFWRMTFPHLKSWKRLFFFLGCLTWLTCPPEKLIVLPSPLTTFQPILRKQNIERWKMSKNVIYSHTSCYDGKAIAWSIRACLTKDHHRLFFNKKSSFVYLCKVCNIMNRFGIHITQTCISVCLLQVRNRFSKKYVFSDLLQWHFSNGQYWPVR